VSAPPSYQFPERHPEHHPNIPPNMPDSQLLWHLLACHYRVNDDTAKQTSLISGIGINPIFGIGRGIQAGSDKALKNKH
jgi:hypothetical protein